MNKIDREEKQSFFGFDEIDLTIETGGFVMRHITEAEEAVIRDKAVGITKKTTGSVLLNEIYILRFHAMCVEWPFKEAELCLESIRELHAHMHGVIEGIVKMACVKQYELLNEQLKNYMPGSKDGGKTQAK